MDKHRCPWVGEDPLYQKYHDQVWEVPVRDDRQLYEMLVLLSGAQRRFSKRLLDSFYFLSMLPPGDRFTQRVRSLGRAAPE